LERAGQRRRREREARDREQSTIPLTNKEKQEREIRERASFIGARASFRYPSLVSSSWQ
jgi:hypothetical protein